MKNLFKNLMLVAVAAMGFTACTETNEEVNAVSEKSVINGVAVIENDDTRSGFVGSETIENEDGSTTTLYKSAWDGTELIKVFGDNGEEKVVEIDADGKFSVEFDSAPKGFTVVSPAEAWTSNSSCTIAKEQTPRENSVDPAVHVLQSQWTATANASYVQMNLQNACYGKMTIKDAVEIEQVEIDLKGLKYHSYEDTLSYTLNATYVKDNTFWFAIEAPMTITEFTVTASCTDGKTLTKSVTIPEGRELKFNWGRVSTFSVSELVETVAPRFTSEKTYSYDNSSWYGSYVDEAVNSSDVLLVFSSDDLGVLQLNFYNAFSSYDIAPGTYTVGTEIYNGSETKYSYYQPVGSSAYQLDGGKVIVSITDDKKYHFDFVDISYNGTTLNSTYTGVIEDFDRRTKLTTPNANATVDGKTITISWDSVDNAEGYRVKLYSPYDEYFEEIITGTEYVYEAQQWDTNYSFTIMSYASDENETYKPSEDAYVDVKIGKDPSTLISLSTMSTGASHNYGYGYTFTNDNDTNFTIVFSDWVATSSSINPGTYNVANSVSYVNQLNVALDASKTYKFEGVSNKLSSGTISVAKDGETYTIEMSLVLDNGTALDYKYVGSLGGNSSEGGETPDPEPDQPGDSGDSSDVPAGYNAVEYVSFVPGSYMDRTYNWIGDFTFDFQGATIKFTMCDFNGPMQAQNKVVVEGVYTNNGNGANTDTMELYNISISGMTGNSGSTVEVSKDGSDYVFKMTMKTVNGDYKFYYKGAL